MFEIEFYEDIHGNSDVKNYLLDLKKRSATSKDARIRFNKTVAYIDLLAEMGTRIGMPVTKHLQGEIWELRPLDDRILYVFFNEGRFVLLHHFSKKTQKTPHREIQKAILEAEDYLRRKTNG